MLQISGSCFSPQWVWVSCGQFPRGGFWFFPLVIPRSGFYRGRFPRSGFGFPRAISPRAVVDFLRSVIVQELEGQEATTNLFVAWLISSSSVLRLPGTSIGRLFATPLCISDSGRSQIFQTGFGCPF